MPATPIYALPSPAPAEPADVPTDMQELAARIEAVFVPGTVAGQVPVWDNTAKKWVPASAPWGPQPNARAQRSTAVNITHAGNGLNVPFEAESWDTDNIWNAPNPERLTCKTPGKYQVAAAVGFSSNATGVRNIRLMKTLAAGGAPIAFNQCSVNGVGGGNFTIPTVSDLIDLALNDYVTVLAYQDSGVTLTLSGTLSMVLVST